MGKAGPDPNALRTRLAQKFVSLADDVTEGFEGFTIGGGAYRIELTAPSGQSTGGGKQALQHLCLQPQRTGHPTIVAGTINAVGKEAQLRTFEYVEAIHLVRFRRRIDLTPRQWADLLERADEILRAADIATQRVGPPAALLQELAEKRKINRVALVVFVVATALALVVLWKVIDAL